MKTEHGQTRFKLHLIGFPFFFLHFEFKLWYLLIRIEVWVLQCSENSCKLMSIEDNVLLMVFMSMCPVLSSAQLRWDEELRPVLTVAHGGHKIKRY